MAAHGPRVHVECCSAEPLEGWQFATTALAVSLALIQCVSTCIDARCALKASDEWGRLDKSLRPKVAAPSKVGPMPACAGAVMRQVAGAMSCGRLWVKDLSSTCLRKAAQVRAASPPRASGRVSMATLTLSPSWRQITAPGELLACLRALVLEGGRVAG